MVHRRHVLFRLSYSALITDLSSTSTRSCAAHPWSSLAALGSVIRSTQWLPDKSRQTDTQSPYVPCCEWSICVSPLLPVNIYFSQTAFKLAHLFPLLPLVLKIPFPSFRRFMINLTPSPTLWHLRDLVDFIHATTSQLVKERKAAMTNGMLEDSAKDLMSLLGIAPTPYFCGVTPNLRLQCRATCPRKGKCISRTPSWCLPHRR
jgi:hypothetical protein